MLQWCSDDSLLSYLLVKRKEFEEYRLPTVKAIANAMKELESQGMKHGNLNPAYKNSFITFFSYFILFRNLLVNKENNTPSVKLNYFLFREENSPENPRYSAPEKGRYTIKSDVYSFGRVVSFIYDEEENSKLVDAPSEIQALVKDCLKMNEGERPTFEQIVNRLASVHE